jgi:hypothetical protein
MTTDDPPFESTDAIPFDKTPTVPTCEIEAGYSALSAARKVLQLRRDHPWLGDDTIRRELLADARHSIPNLDAAGIWQETIMAHYQRALDVALVMPVEHLEARIKASAQRLSDSYDYVSN